MSKYIKTIQDTKTTIPKRFTALSKFTETGSKDDIRTFYTNTFTDIWRLVLDILTNLDTTAKAKKKIISDKDVVSLQHIVMYLFKYAKNSIQKRWQYRSVVGYLEAFMVDSNSFAVKKMGFELLIQFIDILQDNADMPVYDLLMHHLDFTPFISSDETVKLPTFETRVLTSDEKKKFTQCHGPYTEAESLELLTILFNFIKAGDQFDFWWKLFKSRIAPILYPNECKSLDLLTKLDDMGFTQKCPYKIQLLVLDMILDSLEAPKKQGILYHSDKDIYLFLLIFRQSFLLPSQHFEQLTKMIKPYRSWICRDIFLYSWPEIMESNRNTYYRVFIDNLSQTFFMKGEEQYLDLHINMCYEVLEIFHHFPQIEDKLDFETWKDLILALIKVYYHLMSCINSDDSYDKEFGKILERTCIRNLILLFVRSHPAEEYIELYETLHSLLQAFFAVDSVFEFWKKTVLNFSYMVVKQIFALPEEYIPQLLSYPTEMYEFQKKGKKIKTSTKQHVFELDMFLPKDLDQNGLLHLWHKLIWMYGKDNAMNCSALLHTSKVQVLSEIIDIFLKISNVEVKLIKGSNAPPFLHSPEANRLLYLFGEWLIEGCDRQDQGFLDGRVMSYATLCKIICQKCSQKIEKRYLAETYRVLHNGLAVSTNAKVTEGIILHSRNIFNLGHRGVNLLIPDYVKAIEPLLRDNSTASEQLRIESIHILVSIISVCYYYSDCVFISMDQNEEKKANEDPSDEKTGFRSLKRLRGKICQILLGALQDAKYPECQMKCLYALVHILHKESTQQKNTSQLKFIIDGMLSFIMNSNEKIATTAHNAFVSIAQLELFPILDSNLVKLILTQICQVIIQTLSEGKLTRGGIVCSLFYSLVEIMTYVPQGVLEMPGVSTSLFDAIALGLNCSNSTEAQVDASSTPQRTRTRTVLGLRPNQTRSVNTLKNENAKMISEAAEVLLAFTLNQVNNFPTPSGSSILSSSMTEFSYLKEEAGVYSNDPRIHHFIFNDYSVITVMENPERQESVLIIVRDMTGRYCWDYDLSPTDSVSRYKLMQDTSKTEKQDSVELKSNEKHIASEKDKGASEPDAPETAEKVTENNIDEDDIHALPTPAEEGFNGENNNNGTLQIENDELPVPGDEFNQDTGDDLLPTPGDEYQDGELPVPGEEFQGDELPAPGNEFNQNTSDDLLPTPGEELDNDTLPTPGDEYQDSELPVPGEEFQGDELPTPGDEYKGDEPVLEQENDEENSQNNQIEQEEGNTVQETQTGEQEAEDHVEEEEEIDDDPENFPPIFDSRIDTDQTDMLSVLQHHAKEIFPLCFEYKYGSVLTLEQQEINYEQIEQVAKNQIESENSLLKEGKMEPFAKVSLPPKHLSNMYRAFRAFMNNMGLLSYANRPTLCRIEQNHRFYRTLKQLDKVAERETIKIGVIYVKNKQEREQALLLNEDGSPAYKEFVQALGWDVDLRTHKGFLGGLDNSSSLSTGNYAPYYSNATTEVIFHVVTNMPTKDNDNQQIHKKRHVGNDHVHIIWSENDRDYRPWTIVSQFNFVHIVIYPLKDPLFRIQIFTKPEVPLFGPLFDGMIVDKMSLAPLVRLTAINANKAVRYQQQGYKRPYPTRMDLVREICEKNKSKNTTNEDFLRLLFFDQDGNLSIQNQPEVQD